MTEPSTDDSLRSNKTLTKIIYGLYAASFFIGITGIVAIIMNYVKRGDVAGTYLASHFSWQMRTFWISLVVAIIGMVSMIVAIGWIVLIADAIWVIYRLVVGAIRLSENRPVAEGKYGLEA